MINKGTSEQYSISNAIRGCVDSKYKGFEHEVSQDYQRNQDLKNEHGIIIPTEAVLGQRTMTVGNLAGNVSSISDASKLIPFVQRVGVYSSMGLTEFAGFSSDVKVPRGTSAVTSSFLSLDGSADITEGTPTMDSVSFSPTSLGCFTEVSHKLLLQSSVDMDNYLRNLMSESIANKLDLAVIHGSGSSGQPTGMLNATGINTETYSSAIAYADLANALSTLANDSIPLSSLVWVVNPAEYGSLQVKDKGTDTGNYLLETESNPDDINQFSMSRIIGLGLTLIKDSKLDWSDSILAPQEFNTLRAFVFSNSERNKCSTVTNSCFFLCANLKALFKFFSNSSSNISLHLLVQFHL